MEGGKWEGDKRRKREVINKLLSQDAPLDILLISGSRYRGGAWHPNGTINELSSGSYQRREGKWDNFVSRRGMTDRIKQRREMKETEIFKEPNVHFIASPHVTKNCEIYPC
jgi:predicted glycosyltransferase